MNKKKPKIEVLDPVKPTKGAGPIDDDLDPHEVDIPQLVEYLKITQPTSGPKRKPYSEEVKTLAMTLRASGYSQRQVAKCMDIATSTIESWDKDVTTDQLAVSDLSGQVKGHMRNKLMINASSLMAMSMEDEGLAKMSPLQKSIHMKIFIEASRLLSGESTENISHIYRKTGDLGDKKGDIDMKVHEAQAKIKELQAKLGGG